MNFTVLQRQNDQVGSFGWLLCCFLDHRFPNRQRRDLVVSTVTTQQEFLGSISGKIEAFCMVFARSRHVHIVGVFSHSPKTCRFLPQTTVFYMVSFHEWRGVGGFNDIIDTQRDIASTWW